MTGWLLNRAVRQLPDRAGKLFGFAGVEVDRVVVNAMGVGPMPSAWGQADPPFGDEVWKNEKTFRNALLVALSRTGAPTADFADTAKTSAVRGNSRSETANGGNFVWRILIVRHQLSIQP